VVERDAYDPWGKRRFTNGNDDPAGSLANSSQTIRGFTGQEMLADVGLVHLNGRVYDPYIGRMLSADPVVGDPLNGQTWNRYSYVFNNPLAYTDPTGYCAVCIETVRPPPRLNWLARNSIFGDIFKIGITAVCVAIGPGCAPFAPLFAFTGSAVVAGLSGGNFTDAMRAGTFAFIQAGAFQAIGGATGHNPAFGSSAFFVNVAGHAAAGCLMATVSGSSCGSGALSGAVPAFAGPLINGEGFSVRSLITNSMLGGLASVAGGGKFGNGAVTGAFGYLFNAEGGGQKSAPWISILGAALSIDPLNENEPAITSDTIEDYLSSSGGRLGSANTRQLNDAIATALENNGYTVTNGAGRAPEEWIPAPDGGTKGGTYVDITATRGGQVVRIQTTDTLNDGTPTPREIAAAGRIRVAFPADTLLLIPK
jgi:RHS repeat-associated protein